MKCRRFLCVAGVVATALLTIGFSETIPGRWDKVEALASGRGILVTLEGGERFECSFLSSNADSLAIREPERGERELPKSGIKKIETIENTSRGNLLDGTLIGAAIGAGITGIMVASVDSGDRGAAAGVIALGAGIGAGIGLACDAAVGAREVLYKAAPR
ncbi:MAG: hypothetical protein WAO20_22805 [Acidobacteriota bacterium]